MPSKRKFEVRIVNSLKVSSHYLSSQIVVDIFKSQEMIKIHIRWQIIGNKFVQAIKLFSDTESVQNRSWLVLRELSS